jgi:hypothetical protein
LRPAEDAHLLGAVPVGKAGAAMAEDGDSRPEGGQRTKELRKGEAAREADFWATKAARFIRPRVMA